MREIEPKPRKGRTREGTANRLRQEIQQRNREIAASVPHQVTRGGATIYQAAEVSHGNFLEASYRRICAHPSWFRRLEKAHTAKRQARIIDVRSDDPRGEPWRELDTASSSDALLMNLFCYPRVLAAERLPALLGVERGLEPMFGFKPRVPLHGGRVDTTEVDMRLGTLLVEAKLTEPVFPAAPLRKLERYRDFDEVFDRRPLLRGADVCSYQLLRGVLAAHATTGSFCLLADARRPEMQAAWEEVLFAVRLFTLRARLKLISWQEVSATMPVPVRDWLERKYGITKTAV